MPPASPEDRLPQVASASISRVDTALHWATQALSAVTYRPHAEAERLLAHVLRHTRTALLAHPEWAVAQAQAAAYIEAVRRRATGLPLPYILGEIEFFGLTFTVTPGVLIPRPETELLVERAIDWLRAHRARTLVDVGTGSGCIAIAVAAQYPGQRVIAVDLSLKALRVAQANSLRHHVTAAVTWVQGDLLDPVGAPIEMILSNPPYVADPEWERLPYSVRQEPARALLAGPEGLDAIERLLRQAMSRLATGGCMLVEIGETQGNAVRALAQAAFPCAEVTILPDLAGKERVLEVLR
ncbi:MAG: peptide chain release factor N(5)-glutamine methyltransferase [Anaerolineae bacterium]|nr:peptide chain release factor N(5)-glutamine methyltransferase [Anaerolineae bacterium]